MVLLSLRLSDLVILKASENSATWLGLPPENLLGLSIAVVIGSEREARMHDVLECEPIEHIHFMFLRFLR
jgi:light-regulated signal transduction histidine kinase (bacteriophytochrome)